MPGRASTNLQPLVFLAPCSGTDFPGNYLPAQRLPPTRANQPGGLELFFNAYDLISSFHSNLLLGFFLHSFSKIKTLLSTIAFPPPLYMCNASVCGRGWAAAPPDPPYLPSQIASTQSEPVHPCSLPAPQRRSKSLPAKSEKQLNLYFFSHLNVKPPQNKYSRNKRGGGQLGLFPAKAVGLLPPSATAPVPTLSLEGRQQEGGAGRRQGTVLGGVRLRQMQMLSRCACHLHSVRSLKLGHS